MLCEKQPIVFQTRLDNVLLSGRQKQHGFLCFSECEHDVSLVILSHWVQFGLTGLQPCNLLVTFGIVVTFLASTSTQLVSASVDGGTPGPNASTSIQGAAGSHGGDPNPGNSNALNSNQEAIAQFVLQNGDTVGTYDIWTPATN